MISLVLNGNMKGVFSYKYKYYKTGKLVIKKLISKEFVVHCLHWSNVIHKSAIILKIKTDFYMYKYALLD